MPKSSLFDNEDLRACYSVQSTWRLIWGVCLIWVQILTYFLGSLTLLTGFPYIKKDTQNNLNPKVLRQLVLISESKWKKYEPNILFSYEEKGQVDWTLYYIG